jgi:small subunit ribosomal protein S4e
MVKQHLSRLAAPRSWPVKRKGIKFISRPSPGPHSMNNSMPINLILRDLLKITKTTNETKKILHNKEVLVDKKIRKDPNFPVGIFDVIEMPKIKLSYRLVYAKTGKIMVKQIDAKESNIKPCKIINKTILKKGKVQLNLDDGSNLLIDKDKYKVNDTVVILLDKREIKEHLPFDKGALIYIKGGKKIAALAKLQSIKPGEGLQPDNIIFKIKDGEFETRKDYAMVVGKDKPVIALDE